VQSKAEQHRARTNENFSHSVLSNLSSGVLVFGANGLVKTANPAAKAILGFASTTGMSAEDIFRGAAVHLAHATRPVIFPDETIADPAGVAAEIDSVLREGSKRRQVEADYETPAGEKRFLSMTVSRVPAVDGSLLGVACLINDLSELQNIRRQQELQGEISAEMALQLRTSLTTIAGFAQQLANNRDPELAKDLASDIAQEAAQLDRSIGGFLTTKPKAAAAAAGGNAR
jgi:nitrogen fixation/metabolism regulation signal transduction histidine kinase